LAENCIPLLGVVFLDWNLFCVVLSGSAQMLLTGHFCLLRSLELRSDLPRRADKVFMGLLALVMQPFLLTGIALSALQIFCVHRPIERSEALGLLQTRTDGELRGLALGLLLNILSEVAEFRSWFRTGCAGTAVGHATQGFFRLVVPLLLLFGCGFAVDSLGCSLLATVALYTLIKTAYEIRAERPE
jgi:hypothetical protein